MLKQGDSVYVYSNSLISKMIVWVSSGGKHTKDIPSHEARINKIIDDKAELIEVVFSGKRLYNLENYIKQGCQIWIKRDDMLDNANAIVMLNYLRNLEVKGYDFGLICGFLARFTLRKIFPRKWNFDWITKVWDSRIAFVCSEFQNAGRRYMYMKIKENETPYDNFRKIPAEEITEYNIPT